MVLGLQHQAEIVIHDEDTGEIFIENEFPHLILGLHTFVVGEDSCLFLQRHQGVGLLAGDVVVILLAAVAGEGEGVVGGVSYILVAHLYADADGQRK